MIYYNRRGITAKFQTGGRPLRIPNRIHPIPNTRNVLRVAVVKPIPQVVVNA
jgi:hypothetical protein